MLMAYEYGRERACLTWLAFGGFAEKIMMMASSRKDRGRNVLVEPAWPLVGFLNKLLMVMTISRKDTGRNSLV